MVERAETKSTPGTKSLRKLAKGQFLELCRQETAFPVPVGQTQVLAETPLDRRTFFRPRLAATNDGIRVGKNWGDWTPLVLFLGGVRAWSRPLLSVAERLMAILDR
jgi:hypothetical protein